MIAMNFRKYADALIAQLELDLSGVQDSATRAAWWSWLMESGKTQPIERPEPPAWWRALRAAATKLARRIKTAMLQLFNL